MERAFGIDHFEPEKARLLTMVDKGIFKYSPNAMYVFGFPFILLKTPIWNIFMEIKHLFK